MLFLTLIYVYVCVYIYIKRLTIQVVCSVQVSSRDIMILLDLFDTPPPSPPALVNAS